MSDELGDNDYIKILEFYKKPIPKSKRLLQLQAEKILAEKLCRCIKKVDKTNEARSIGICTKSIINQKGFTRGKFNCKGKQTIHLKKYKYKTTKKSSNKNITKKNRQ